MFSFKVQRQRSQSFFTWSLKIKNLCPLACSRSRSPSPQRIPVADHVETRPVRAPGQVQEGQVRSRGRVIDIEEEFQVVPLVKTGKGVMTNFYSKSKGNISTNIINGTWHINKHITIQHIIFIQHPFFTYFVINTLLYCKYGGK